MQGVVGGREDLLMFGAMKVAGGKRARLGQCGGLQRNKQLV